MNYTLYYIKQCVMYATLIVHFFSVVVVAVVIAVVIICKCNTLTYTQALPFIHFL